jgi:hypothetical protein
LRREIAILAAEEKQRLISACDIKLQNPAKCDEMVASLMNRIEHAIDPRDHIIEHGRTVGGQAMRDAGKLVAALVNEAAAKLLLVAGEYVHTETARTLDAWPVRRAFVREKGDQRRIQGDRREGANDRQSRCLQALSR